VIATPVLVFGDLMLDIMVTGTCHRMSPEAPSAPVLLAKGTTHRPGGAANVAVGVAAMGGYATLIGALGCDTEGGLLAASLSGLNGSRFLVRDAVATTSKIRFVGDGRQMMRVDHEDPKPLTEAEIARTMPELTDYATLSKAMVISDYAKGMVAPELAAKMVSVALNGRIPRIVDTKTPLAKHFIGATVLKPNLPEIAAALGCPEPQTDEQAADCAWALWHATDVMYVLLTRGAAGICLVGAPGVLHIPAHQVTAVDVTGAGDAVAAGLALAMARGASIDEAARFANAAGAVVVTHRGTVCPTPDEIGFFYDPYDSVRDRSGRSLAGSAAQNRLH
jgi:D-beta-D-heptose 7-phosphate kinase / D-beta-D-heptose 1-phosphate adenosyltransferase